MMLDSEFEPILHLVEEAARLEQSRGAEEMSSHLVRLGWEPEGSVSLPFPRRLGRAGLALGIEGDGESVVIGVTLREWPVDWDSAEYVRAATDGYEAPVRELLQWDERLTAEAGGRFEVEAEGLVLDPDECFFVQSVSRRVSRVHLTLGVEHLDPDDTPIRVSLHLSW
ncbi:hypothetical protein OG471_16700 [Streptomyces sp. NBC_01336]|uniref:hypothetical protein n=1 Tax=Streptomyces sp. NBC_01336 TaxID=2903829 RepID=UPI002E0E67E2|nr:hypothetical protein OG471_16700 [Streptomyces sp. NBC_01336]